jgi:hypothetical protein
VWRIGSLGLTRRRRGIAFWAGRLTASTLNNTCGYGSLRSQGRHPPHSFADSVFNQRSSQTQLPDLAARFARGLLSSSHPLPTEGAGNAGRLVRPQPRVVVENTRVSHHGHTGNTRHSPRNGFNGFLRALPGDRACLPPSPRNAKHCRELMPASGHQDHTTSPSAIAPFVIGSIRVHRIPPRVRDDRETPLLSRRDGASW